MPIDPAAIVAQARTWLDTPFRHQGRIKGLGVDCGGLLIGVGRELGLEIAEPPAYSLSPDQALFAAYLQSYAIPVHGPMQPGDILHLAFAGDPRHVAIATDVGLLHAWAKPGRVVEHRLDEVWQRRLRGVWRLK